MAFRREKKRIGDMLINEHAPKRRKCVKKAAPKAEAVAEEKPKRKCVRKSVQK